MRVAAIQMRSGTQPDANLEALEPLLAQAKARGARYALTPEMTVAFAENRDGLARVAGPWEGNSAIARLGAMAKAHGLFLHCGSLGIALPDGRFANRSVLFGPDGACARPTTRSTCSMRTCRREAVPGERDLCRRR